MGVTSPPSAPNEPESGVAVVASEVVPLPASSGEPPPASGVAVASGVVPFPASSDAPPPSAVTRVPPLLLSPEPPELDPAGADAPDDEPSPPFDAWCGGRT